jgi:hypothetical protein
VNTPAFWVFELPTSYGFAVASMIGAGFSALVLLLPKSLAQSFLVVTFLFGINQAFNWHSGILGNYSRPSSFPEIIKNNWPAGTCIGLDPFESDNHSIERMELYKFHLHDYEVRRMHIQEWADNCNGPFVTSDIELGERASNFIIAREVDTELLLISKY